MGKKEKGEDIWDCRKGVGVEEEKKNFTCMLFSG